MKSEGTPNNKQHVFLAVKLAHSVTIKKGCNSDKKNCFVKKKWHEEEVAIF